MKPRRKRKECCAAAECVFQINYGEPVTAKNIPSCMTLRSSRAPRQQDSRVGVLSPKDRRLVHESVRQTEGERGSSSSSSSLNYICSCQTVGVQRERVISLDIISRSAAQATSRAPVPWQLIARLTSDSMQEGNEWGRGCELILHWSSRRGAGKKADAITQVTKSCKNIACMIADSKADIPAATSAAAAAHIN